MSLLIGIPSLQDAWLVNYINYTNDIHVLTAPREVGSVPARHIHSVRRPSERGPGLPLGCRAAS